MWSRPEAFLRGCEQLGLRDPIDTLQALFTAFKALQAAVFGAWCVYFAARTGQPNNWGTPAGALGVLLIAAGQALNVSAFVRLGRVGVFYGNRLGRETPWRDGFPFSWLAHPQYVGAATSIWGLFLLLRYPNEDWLFLPLLETIYYGLAAHLERLPGPDASARSG